MITEDIIVKKTRLGKLTQTVGRLDMRHSQRDACEQLLEFTGGIYY